MQLICEKQLGGQKAMKKNFITYMLTVTALTATISFGNINYLGVSNTAIASAAVVTSLTNCTPKIAVKSTTESTVSLKTSCNAAVKGYKIYRATSPDGKYKCIGTTKSTTFVDKKAKEGQSYYYKVRAYGTVNGVNKTSKASKLAIATCDKGSKYYDSLSNLISEITKSQQAVTPKPTTTPTKPVTPTKPTPTKPVTPTPSDNEQNYDSSFASQVLKLVNIERAKVGLNSLKMSQSLLAPANKRAVEIKTTFSHTRPNGTEWSTVLKEYKVSVQTAGENIAYGYNTPEAVMNGWMNSPGHKANILNANYNNIGVGVYEVNGTVYCTQLFSN